RATTPLGSSTSGCTRRTRVVVSDTGSSAASSLGSMTGGSSPVGSNSTVNGLPQSTVDASGSSGAGAGPPLAAGRVPGASAAVASGAVCRGSSEVGGVDSDIATLQQGGDQSLGRR